MCRKRKWVHFHFCMYCGMEWSVVPFRTCCRWRFLLRSYQECLSVFILLVILFFWWNDRMWCNICGTNNLKGHNEFQAWVLWFGGWQLSLLMVAYVIRSDEFCILYFGLYNLWIVLIMILTLFLVDGYPLALCMEWGHFWHYKML